MRTLKCTALFAAALLAGGFALAAADMPQGQLYLIHEEIANPSKLAAYESTTQEVLGAIKANSTMFPAYDVVMTDDFSYYFIMPIKSVSDMSVVPQAFAEIAKKMGEEKFADLWRRGGDPMFSSNDFIVMERPDLSYVPATALAANDARAVGYDIYYLLPGREADAEAISHEWQALFKAKGVTDSFKIFQAVSGNDLPIWAVVTYGKSPADLAARQEANSAKLGDEGSALQARSWQLVRRFNRRVGMARPDLSYRPAPMTAAN
jgi:hypothetical protein